MLDNEFNNDIIELIDENGNEVDFELISSFELDDTRYAVVAPIDSDSDDAYILRVEQDENGEDIFVGIDDEDEFNDVVEAYNELLEEYECDDDCDCHHHHDDE